MQLADCPGELLEQPTVASGGTEHILQTQNCCQEIMLPTGHLEQW